MNMNDFILFNQAVEEYQNAEKTVKKQSTYEQTSETCSHENVIIEKGMGVCIDCGEVIHQKINHDKEWRYYGQNDSKHSSDPNRVQPRKTEEKSIFKDVENLGFSEKIIVEANKIYAEVTKGKIFRASSRKSIVFACVFHAHKLCDKTQTYTSLIKTFNLERKAGMYGLKYVNLNAPKNSVICTAYISPPSLVEEIMGEFNATVEQKEEVKSLYEKIKNKSSRLNRSRPQSVACGLVFYWICMTGKDISLKDFTKKAGLSELTINKIAKEIAEVLQTPHIV